MADCRDTWRRAEPRRYSAVERSAGQRRGPHSVSPSDLPDNAGMRSRHLAVLALVLSAACSQGEESPTLVAAENTPRAVATEFAKAVVSDDFSSARALVCQGGVGALQALGEEFPFQDGRAVGRPGPEPPSGDVHVVIVSAPSPDLFVSFEAAEDGEGVNGYIDVTFGGGNCVKTYGMSRALG
jgi:hypothetical protein